MNQVFFYFIFLLSFGLINSSDIYPPTFTRQSSDTNVVVGYGKYAQCAVKGSLPVTYQWLKDGMLLNQTSRRLKLRNVQKWDAGRYQCIAENPAGSIISRKWRLSVYYMDMLDEPLMDVNIHVHRHETAVFSIPSIRSNPPPVIEWSDEYGNPVGNTRYQVTLNNSLIILDAIPSDSGVYKARALNEDAAEDVLVGRYVLSVDNYSVNSRKVSLIVAPTDVSTVMHESVRFLCVVNASPLDHLLIEWKMNEVPLERTTVEYKIDDKGRSLVLLNVDLTYEANYSCHVSFSLESSVLFSRHAQLTVNQRPQVMKMNEITWCELGGEVMLDCFVSGRPKPLVTWYKNAKDISLYNTDGRFIIYANNTLRITNLKFVDTGVYQCGADSSIGHDISHTWLRVNSSIPRITSLSRNITILEHKDAVLSCRAKGAPPPLTTWIFKDKPLQDVSGSRFRIDALGDLHIMAVTLDDVGLYVCRKQNDAGVDTLEMHLTVIERTDIINPPTNMEVVLAEEAKLSCGHTKSTDLHVVTVWLRAEGHHEIRMTESSRVRFLPDGALIISQVRAADAGKYICQVISSAGNATSFTHLVVVERPFPPYNVRAKKIAGLLKSVNVSWSPSFDGNSPITRYIVQSLQSPITFSSIEDSILSASWTTENNNVSRNVSSIVLTQLEAASTYIFRVMAENKLGTGPSSEPSNKIFLPQEAPSSAPRRFIGAARSQTEITVQWQAPDSQDHNGKLLGYVLRYRLNGYSQSTWRNYNITNVSQRSYIIQDLIVWKDYEIQIAAYNTRGVGVFSKSIVVKTKEGVPDAAPTDVKAISLNSTTIQVSWLPPNPQKINGINQGYKLEAWTAEHSHTQPVSTMISPPSSVNLFSTHTAQFGGLRKYTAYNITVLCFTSPGDGVRSRPAYVHTDEDVPGKVSRLRVEDITDRSGTIVWEAPGEPNGAISQYTVEYGLSNDTHAWHPIVYNVSSAQRKWLHMNSLQAFTEYVVRVQAWTSVGAGEYTSVTFTSRVQPVLPQPPTHLAVSNIQAFSVVLQFSPQFDGNASIIEWLVEAWSSRNRSWNNHSRHAPAVSGESHSSFQVSGLMPFTSYRLRLRARNVMGYSGPSSPTQKFQTIQSAPAHAPENVTVRVLSSRSFRVAWIPLQNIEWHGRPRGYNIFYQIAATNEPRIVVISAHDANFFVLDRLQEFTDYEVYMRSVNDVGHSANSTVIRVRTHESVPSSGPENVTAKATSSTTAVISWSQVPDIDRNGVITGYSVCYAPVDGRSRVKEECKVVGSNLTHTTTLTQLHKHSSYRIRVLATTRLGAGNYSLPGVLVRTLEDVPGIPSNISFPDVTFNTARIIWEEPDEPNGVIIKYRVSYRAEMDSRTSLVTEDLSPETRTYTAYNLVGAQYYHFMLSARTKIGWGRSARARVYTTNTRHPPQSPQGVRVLAERVLSDRVTVSWLPDNSFISNHSPIRYYIMGIQQKQSSWNLVPGVISPQTQDHVVTHLKPFTSYRFRLKSVNDLGVSSWSDSSLFVRTLPSAPTGTVSGISVIPIKDTTVRVSWTALDLGKWNGGTNASSSGYRIVYKNIDEQSYLPERGQIDEVFGIQAKYHLLEKLISGFNYEIQLQAFNLYGSGALSTPIQVYVGEAFPSGTPLNVDSRSVSSTEIRVTWQPPLKLETNGQIQGYKVFYKPVDRRIKQNSSDSIEQVDIAPSAYRSLALVNLKMYTTYHIQILAFNMAGDGPRSQVIRTRTLTGIPGIPVNLSFVQITMNSLKVVWNEPDDPNGLIQGYLVMYETANPNKESSKQVRQKVNGTHLLVLHLEEMTTYSFSVQALTIDYGQPAKANITTGPQAGSPMAVKSLSLVQKSDQITLYWRDATEAHQAATDDVIGYIVEARLNDHDQWLTLMKTSDGVRHQLSVSYTTLTPSALYQLRVMVYNRFGVSYPAVFEQVVATPSKQYQLYNRPFYHTTWFMVSLAALLIIILISITATLCVKSKSYKYKRKAEEIEETLSMEALADGFTIEHISSRRNTLKRNTLKRHNHANMLAPPRPAPASVTYNSDTESKYDEQRSQYGVNSSSESSSVTEKPSDLSISSQEDSDNIDELYFDSGRQSLVAHYSNVNELSRQSWRRQKPVPRRQALAAAISPGVSGRANNVTVSNGGPSTPSTATYSNYSMGARNYAMANHPTDSEQEGSAVISLNGAEVVVNNKAGSRAPLGSGFNAFSSFV